MEFDALEKGDGGDGVNAVDMPEIAAPDTVFLHQLDEGAADVIFKLGREVGEDEDLFIFMLLGDRIERKL